MDWLHCYNKNCPNFYKREIKGHTDYMCSALPGQKIRPYDLGSGRLIQIKNLKACPLEKPRKVDLVADSVGACNAPHHSIENAMGCLAGLLWDIAKGTRWEEDARVGIMGVCPSFFKDETENK